MSVQTKKTKLKKFLAFAPLILLYASTLNEFDFNYLNYKYFSINFPFILIYYWSLKRSESLGYGSIFIASLFNDVVLGFPIGLSGLSLSKRTFATSSSVLIIYSSIIFLSLSFSNFNYSLSNSFPLRLLNFSFN